MFIGHYAVSLAAKRWAPQLSLGWLFLAVQGLDVLFGSFVLLGIEKMAIVPGFTAYNPYDLIFMPYSHSLLGALGWSALVVVIARLALGRTGGAAAALVLGACVLSHWVLDVPMHTPDLPLAGNDSAKVGLGLWRHRDLSLAAELVALWAGVFIWWRATGGATGARARTMLVQGVLTALLLATPCMPPPQGPAAFAITALAGYAGLAAYAAWVDRGRGAALKNPR